MTSVHLDAPAGRASRTSRPPIWLIAATGALAFGSLAMAVAETSLWMHYLIDGGEAISLVGLAFMTAAGIYLYRQGRLAASLALAIPWLLFPVITQGDQIIDNLSIDWMRAICHVLLAVLFGTPVAIVVLAVRYAVAPEAGAAARTRSGWLAIVPGVRQLAGGRIRQGSALLAAMLLTLEMWVAARFLGLLMIVTLAILVWGVLVWGFSGPDDGQVSAAGRRRSERVALIVLLAGAAASLGLFVGYKNRPGAYQGSPSYFMDPSQRDAGFRLDRIPVPSQPVAPPADADGVRAALTEYGRAFERLLSGYYILDRNYNYDFHNRLFLRSTPLVPNYRAVGLQLVREAQAIRADADGAFDAARQTVPPGDPMGALMDDVRAYADFTFGRAPVLEKMSAGFQQTQAGLQHATHLYEGEGKVLGVRLAELLDKHRRVLTAPSVQPVVTSFVTLGRAVHDKYANRIVGF